MISKIVAYMHCTKCLAEMPSGTCPADWARLNVGYTPTGIQVWCQRHDINVVNINMENEVATSVTRANVFNTLDNALVNGYTDLKTEPAETIAIDLTTYDADLEASAVDEILPFVKEWQKTQK